MYSISENKGVDRISALPDFILHDILSFLPTKQVVQTCVLSKRWKTLWTHIPTLDLNFFSYDSKPEWSSLDTFKRFVLRVLAQHSGEYIKKLTYSCFVYDEGRFLTTALAYAPFYKAQKLYIITDYAFDSLWSSLSACKFLTALKITCLSAANLESLVLPSLRKLVLDICDDYSELFCFVEYYYDDDDDNDGDDNDDDNDDDDDDDDNNKDDVSGILLNEKTFSGCPNLKCLVVFHFRTLSGSVVFAPKLEILELQNDVLSGKKHSQELVLCAPNLRSVKFTNVLPYLKSVSEFECIEKVYISVDKDDFGIRSRRWKRMEQNLSGLLRVFHQASSFTLPLNATQVMFKRPSLNGCCFHNLRHLEFRTKWIKEMTEVSVSSNTFSNFVDCPNLLTYRIGIEIITISLSPELNLKDIFG